MTENMAKKALIIKLTQSLKIALYIFLLDSA